MALTTALAAYGRHRQRGENDFALLADLLAGVDHRAGRVGGRGHHVEGVGAGGLELGHLRAHVGRVTGVVGGGAHDHAVGLAAEAGLQPVYIVGPVVVVLVEDGDLVIGLVLQDVRGVHPGLRAVVQLPAQRPGELPEVLAPVVGAGGHEELRDRLAVPVVANRQVGWRPQLSEVEEDFVLLRQLTSLGRSVGRAVRVIENVELDLPAVDPTLFLIDVVEVGRHGFRNGVVGRRCPGGREDASEQDLVARYPRVRLVGAVVRLLRAAGEQCHRPRGEQRRDAPSSNHYSPPSEL